MTKQKSYNKIISRIVNKTRLKKIQIEIINKN